MLHPSTKRLIDKLDEMTRKKRVGWEESDNGAIKHDTEGYRVTLTAAPHSLLLTDTLGREIETCTPEDFAGETDATGRPYSEFVEDLYREAHRHARGAEKAISALLSSLDEADAKEDDAETAEAAPFSQPESFDHAEDDGDESSPLEDHELPEPEYEGQADMQAAIAAMADQMNAVPPAAAHMAEDYELEAAPEADPEPAVAPPAMPATTEAPVDTPAPAPEPEPVIQADPYAPFAGSEDTARTYAVAAEFEPPAPPNQPETVEAEPSADEPFGGENEVWEAIRNSGEEPEVTIAEPEVPEEEPAASVQRPAPVFGSSLFSSSLSDLSQYRPQDASPAPESAPEPASEPTSEAAPEPQFEHQPDPSPEVAPDPAPEPAPEQPTSRSFSLSGITSGFGLGSTHSGHRVQQEAPPAAAPPAERGVIDGTVDLPEDAPAAAVETAVEWRMEQDEEFGFTEADLKPGIPAKPLPAVVETAPEPETPSQDSDTDADAAPPPRPNRRFNPWN